MKTEGKRNGKGNGDRKENREQRNGTGGGKDKGDGMGIQERGKTGNRKREGGGENELRKKRGN